MVIKSQIKIVYIFVRYSVYVNTVVSSLNKYLKYNFYHSNFMVVERFSVQSGTRFVRHLEPLVLFHSGVCVDEACYTHFASSVLFLSYMCVVYLERIYLTESFYYSQNSQLWNV